MHEVSGALERIGPRAPQQLPVAETSKMFERVGPLAIAGRFLLREFPRLP
jgi:hypothetical protein